MCLLELPLYSVHLNLLSSIPHLNCQLTTPKIQILPSSSRMPKSLFQIHKQMWLSNNSLCNQVPISNLFSRMTPLFQKLLRKLTKNSWNKNTPKLTKSLKNYLKKVCETNEEYHKFSVNLILKYYLIRINQ